jgi:hypothetical protein
MPVDLVSIDAAIAQAMADGADDLTLALALRRRMEEFERRRAELGAQPTAAQFGSAARWQYELRRWRQKQARLRAERDELERAGKCFIAFRIKPTTQRLAKLNRQRKFAANSARSRRDASRNRKELN